MSSRDQILAAIRKNQPSMDQPSDQHSVDQPSNRPSVDPLSAGKPLVNQPQPIFSVMAQPDIATSSVESTGTIIPEPVAPDSSAQAANSAQKFMELLTAIGGEAFLVKDFDRIAQILKEKFPEAARIVSTCTELSGKGLDTVLELNRQYEDPHTLQNVDVAVLKAHFGVAENGACWITEDRMIVRVLPFICQSLVLVLHKKDIVPHMHAAYQKMTALEQGQSPYGFGTYIAGPSKTADIEQSLVLGAHGPRSMMTFLLDEGINDEGFF